MGDTKSPAEMVNKLGGSMDSLKEIILKNCDGPLLLR